MVAQVPSDDARTTATLCDAKFYGGDGLLAPGRAVMRVSVPSLIPTTTIRPFSDRSAHHIGALR